MIALCSVKNYLGVKKLKKNKFISRLLGSFLVVGVLLCSLIATPFISAFAMSVPNSNYADIRYGDEYDDYIDIVFSYDDYIVGSGSSLKTVTLPIHIGVSLEGDYGIRITDYWFTNSYWYEPDDAGMFDGSYVLTPDEPIFDSSTYELIELRTDYYLDFPAGIVTPLFTSSYNLTGFVSSCRTADETSNPTALDVWEVADYINTNDMYIDEGFTFVGTFYDLGYYSEEISTFQYTYYRFYALHFSGLYGYLTYFVPYGNTLFNNSVLTPTDIPIEPVRTYADGYNIGYSSGYSAGNAHGQQVGYESGLSVGYNNGYTVGDSDGYSRGYDEGYDIGYDEGLESGGGGTIVVDELDYTRTIAENVNNLLSIQIFPSISFRTILLMSFGLVLAFAIFKFIF